MRHKFTEISRQSVTKLIEISAPASSKTKRNAAKAGLQIILLIGSIFAFAYIIKDMDGKEVSLRIEREGAWFGIFKLLIKTQLANVEQHGELFPHMKLKKIKR